MYSQEEEGGVGEGCAAGDVQDIGYCGLIAAYEDDAPGPGPGPVPVPVPGGGE
eukprot:CAMPEP_0182438682 /NCGR_PEP_ID=MMETSP1167-20130531/85947_1 /TAXON_ID=2988 /ORGANISM="Mallomonas Sp, Strain CCMP3275" /LENGTH=52 /DNA_ID=CAMNT_0024632157 /DNA_START=267 /DNA_END=425 /DNA_ORIENTATION=-